MEIRLPCRGGEYLHDQIRSAQDTSVSDFAAVTYDQDIGLYNGFIVIRIQLNITRGNVDFTSPLVFSDIFPEE